VALARRLPNVRPICRLTRRAPSFISFVVVPGKVVQHMSINIDPVSGYSLRIANAPVFSSMEKLIDYYRRNTLIENPSGKIQLTCGILKNSHLVLKMLELKAQKLKEKEMANHVYEEIDEDAAKQEKKPVGVYEKIENPNKMSVGELKEILLERGFDYFNHTDRKQLIQMVLDSDDHGRDDIYISSMDIYS
jgi:hypothetical protein